MSDLGHNNPPPFIGHEANIGDLYDEAKNFLDGAPIKTPGEAEAVATILDRARKAWKAADEQRKTEKRPHDDAAQAVQDLWNPLLAKAKKIETVAKAATTAWQLALEVEQRAEADRLAKEALDAMQAAQAAQAVAKGSTRLDEAEVAEEALRTATAAQRAATKAGKAKPLVGTGGGRSIGLRSYWIAELTDPGAALKHYREQQPEALKAWLLEQAQRDVNAGARSIPGINIREDRRAA